MFIAGLMATSHEDVQFCIVHTGRQGAPQFISGVATMLGTSAETVEKRFINSEAEQADVVLAFSDDAIADFETMGVIEAAKAADVPVYVVSHDTD